MVSWWAMTVKVYDRAERGIEPAHTKVEELHGVWGPLGAYRQDFSKFVLEGTANVKRLRVPQIQRLRAKGRREVDFIGKVENFIPDVNVIREKLGLEPVEKLPRHNRTGPPPGRKAPPPQPDQAPALQRVLRRSHPGAGRGALRHGHRGVRLHVLSSAVQRGLERRVVYVTSPQVSGPGKIHVHSWCSNRVVPTPVPGRGWSQGSERKGCSG